MSIKSKNSTLVYVIAIAVIIIAFLLLGGESWLNGMMHGGRPMDLNHLNWGQIIISLIIGFILGRLSSKRKW